MIVIASEGGRGGRDAGWDVYDGKTDDGREVSFYGFSVVRRGRGGRYTRLPASRGDAARGSTRGPTLWQTYVTHDAQHATVTAMVGDTVFFALIPQGQQRQMSKAGFRRMYRRAR
jgi:hypothetical protein